MKYCFIICSILISSWSAEARCRSVPLEDSISHSVRIVKANFKKLKTVKYKISKEQLAEAKSLGLNIDSLISGRIAYFEVKRDYLDSKLNKKIWVNFLPEGNGLDIELKSEEMYILFLTGSAPNYGYQHCVSGPFSKKRESIIIEAIQRKKNSN